MVTTAANGLSSTTTVYNGTGTVLDTRTDTKAINAGGSTSETVADYSTNGALIDQTVTTVSSDGKTTTIASDNNGAGINNQVETLAEQANGSIVNTVGDYSSTGALIAQTVKTTASNGLSWTLTQDETGGGTIDNTQTDSIVLNADGSATETFADTNGSLNSSPDGKTDSTAAVTATSANGLAKTVVTTGMNDDYSDSNTLTDSKVINADGSAAETIAVTVPSSNGASVARDTETVNTSANGLSQTTQLSAGGTTIYSAAATTGLDGSKTSTVALLQSGRNALRRGCNHHQRQRPVGFPAKRAQRLHYLQPFRDDRHKHGRQRYRYGLGYQFERRYHGRNRHHGERQWAQQKRRDRVRWRRGRAVLERCHNAQRRWQHHFGSSRC